MWNHCALYVLVRSKCKRSEMLSKCILANSSITQARNSTPTDQLHRPPVRRWCCETMRSRWSCCLDWTVCGVAESNVPGSLTRNSLTVYPESDQGQWYHLQKPGFYQSILTDCATFTLSCLFLWFHPPSYEVVSHLATRWYPT